MVGDQCSSLSLRTTFSFPPLIGVDVTKLSAPSAERLCSVSDLGLMLYLTVRPLAGPTPDVLAPSDLTTDIEDGGEDTDREQSGRLRKMEGENAVSLLMADFPAARGERKPAFS